MYICFTNSITLKHLTLLAYNTTLFTCMRSFKHSNVVKSKTFTFSHFADAFIQSDLQYIKQLIFKRQTVRKRAHNTKSQTLFK